MYPTGPFPEQIRFAGSTYFSQISLTPMAPRYHRGRNAFNPPRASYRYRSATIWFTGVPGGGKTTLANRLEIELRSPGVFVESMDGDKVRNVLSNDFGISKR